MIMNGTGSRMPNMPPATSCLAELDAGVGVGVGVLYASDEPVFAGVLELVGVTTAKATVDRFVPLVGQYVVYDTAFEAMLQSQPSPGL
jgi:hypothetical protein